MFIRVELELWAYGMWGSTAVFAVGDVCLCMIPWMWARRWQKEIWVSERA